MPTKHASGSYTFGNHQNNTQQRSSTKRHIFLFLKVFTITSIVTAAVILGTGTMLRSYVRPPELPGIDVIASPIHMPPVSSNTASSAQSDNREDEYNFGGTSPELLALMEGWERKPDFYTVMILGLDRGINTNVIMVAAYDNINQQAYLVSIPRDTRVDVQRNRRKIVAAYPAGRVHGGGHDAGIAMVKREIQTLIGFRPDFYVMVNFDAFVNIIDGIGGVEVDVPFHMRYDDPYQDLHIDIQPGLQVLDGQNALHFARFRRANRGFRGVTDYQRIENQQLIISTVLEELMSPRAIRQIPNLISTYSNYITTDLDLGNQLWFAEQIVRAGGINSLSTYTIPMAGGSGSPAYYEFAHRDGVLELINRTINPFTQDITPAMVRIIAE